MTEKITELNYLVLLLHANCRFKQSQIVNGRKRVCKRVCSFWIWTYSRTIVLIPNKALKMASPLEAKKQSPLLLQSPSPLPLAT